MYTCGTAGPLLSVSFIRIVYHQYPSLSRRNRTAFSAGMLIDFACGCRESFKRSALSVSLVFPSSKFEMQICDQQRLRIKARRRHSNPMRCKERDERDARHQLLFGLWVLNVINLSSLQPTTRTYIPRQNFYEWNTISFEKIWAELIDTDVPSYFWMLSVFSITLTGEFNICVLTFWWLQPGHSRLTRVSYSRAGYWLIGFDLYIGELLNDAVSCIS